MAKAWTVLSTSRDCYLLRWIDSDGRTRQMTTKTKSARRAERQRAEKEIEIEAAEPKRDLTWSEFVFTYRDLGLAGRASSTVAHWGSVAQAIEAFRLPAQPDEIDSLYLSRFAAWLLQHKRPATAESYLKRLRAALRWASEQGIIKRSPKLSIPHATTARGRAITGEEFDRIVAAADAEIRPILQGLWASGLRIGELLDLHWTDERHWRPVNVDRPARPVLLVIPGTRQKSRRAETIPASPEFAELLRALPGRSGRIFPSDRSADYVGRRISEAGQVAGVVVRRDDRGPGFATAHDLRRSFATRWAEAGLPESMLAAIMRHRSIETTRQFYEQVDAMRLADSMARLCDVLCDEDAGGDSDHRHKSGEERELSSRGDRI